MRCGVRRTAGRLPHIHLTALFSTFPGHSTPVITPQQPQFTSDQLRKVAAMAKSPGYIKPRLAFMETWADSEASRMAHMCFIEAQSGKLFGRFWMECPWEIIEEQPPYQGDPRKESWERYHAERRHESHQRDKLKDMLIQAIGKHLPGTSVEFQNEIVNSHPIRAIRFAVKISWKMV